MSDYSETVEYLNGKTVASASFDGYNEFLITFTDGTKLVIEEKMTAGQIGWDIAFPKKPTP